MDALKRIHVMITFEVAKKRGQEKQQYPGEAKKNKQHMNFALLVEEELKQRRSYLVYNLIRSPLYQAFTHPLVSTIAKYIPFIFPSIKSLVEYFGSYHYFSP